MKLEVFDNELGFSGSFLKWMINYLSDRRHFVQIDDRRSDMAHVAFGVPQGSILGPVIFNLYVADLQNNVNCQCFQYADDPTLYINTKVSDLSGATTDINHNLNRLGEYSNESNLALNATKTNWMLVSTPQMSRYHSLDRIGLRASECHQVIRRSLGLVLRLERACYKTTLLLLWRLSCLEEDMSSRSV